MGGCSSAGSCGGCTSYLPIFSVGTTRVSKVLSHGTLFAVHLVGLFRDVVECTVLNPPRVTSQAALRFHASGKQSLTLCCVHLSRACALGWWCCDTSSAWETVVRTHKVERRTQANEQREQKKVMGGRTAGEKRRRKGWTKEQIKSKSKRKRERQHAT